MSYFWTLLTVAGSAVAGVATIAYKAVKASGTTKPAGQVSVISAIVRAIGELIAIVLVYPVIGALARAMPKLGGPIRQVQKRLLRRLDIDADAEIDADAADSP